MVGPTHSAKEKWQLDLSELNLICSCGEICIMRYCRNKDYGIILTQIGTAIFEIQPNKLETAQSLKRNIGAMGFVEVFEATACFEKFPKSRFIVIAKSVITSYISSSKPEEKIFFQGLL